MFHVAGYLQPRESYGTLPRHSSDTTVQIPDVVLMGVEVVHLSFTARLATALARLARPLGVCNQHWPAFGLGIISDRCKSCGLRCKWTMVVPVSSGSSKMDRKCHMGLIG
jgi:hypothetical protein